MSFVSIFSSGACDVVVNSTAHPGLWEGTLSLGQASNSFLDPQSGLQCTVSVDANGVVTLSAANGFADSGLGWSVEVTPTFDISSRSPQIINAIVNDSGFSPFGYSSSGGAHTSLAQTGAGPPYALIPNPAALSTSGATMIGINAGIGI